MRRAGLLIAAALALGGPELAYAAPAAPVKLPLKLGSYETPKCNQTYDGVDEPMALSKKGYNESGDEGDVTFVSVAPLGQNRYRIRTYSYDEMNHRHYFWEIWQISSSTSFTRVDQGAEEKAYHRSADNPFQPSTYHYCGAK